MKVADVHGESIEIGAPVLAWGDTPATVIDIVDDEGTAHVKVTFVEDVAETEVFPAHKREADFYGPLVVEELEAVTG